MRQPDVWWDHRERHAAPELVSESALENLAANQPVRDGVA
jgi:amidase